MNLLKCIWPHPVADFKKASVSFAGREWDIRFDKLYEKLPVHILPETKGKYVKENVWKRTNLWILHISLKNNGENMSLIALWDGQSGDRNGGTEHIVKTAKQQGARVNVININKI
jgi:hypothetical protein